MFDKLCSRGSVDRPVGMCHLVAATLQCVLEAMRQPLLPNMSVSVALNQFIEVGHSCPHVCHQSVDDIMPAVNTAPP